MDEARKRELQNRIIIAAKRLTKALEYRAGIQGDEAGPDRLPTVYQAERFVEVALNWLTWSAGAFISAEERHEIGPGDLGAGYEGLPETVTHPVNPTARPKVVKRWR